MIGSTYLVLNLSKMFYYRSKSSRKVRDFQKLSNKESYFIFQSVSTKSNKTYKFISWTNFLEEHHIQSPEIWGKDFTDCFKKSFHGCMFSILAIIQHIMGNELNCDVKSSFILSVILPFVLTSSDLLLLNWN